MTLTELLLVKLRRKCYGTKSSLSGSQPRVSRITSIRLSAAEYRENQQTDGVAIHAHIVSQLLRLGLGNAALIKTINEWQESLWDNTVERNRNFNRF